MTRRILYIAPSLPILTCTFIYREIFDLRELGYEIDTISMNRPAPDDISQEALELLDTTLYLDQIPFGYKITAFLKSLVLKPILTARCLGIFLAAAPMKSFRDYRRLGYHLIEACYLAFECQKQTPDHIHSHFVSGSTSIGMFMSKLLDVPFSFTMHASLIWTDPIALKTKLQRCSFCVSISEFNKQYVLSTYGSAWESKINIVHCGISFPITKKSAILSAAPKQQVSVLAIGQLTKRKGYHVLVDAAKILKDMRIPVSWTIVGEGDQRPILEKMIESYGLQGTVVLVGAQPHENIPNFLDETDIFTLPCVIGDDDTRDGIPVAMMEAMAWRLPVVSTDIVGLPELIQSGHDGILVEPESPQALADAIISLAESPKLRQEIGAAAEKKVDREFNSSRSAKQLAALFHASG